MKVLVHFSPESLSNSYVLYGEPGSTAIVVDPRAFDIGFFELLESRNLDVVAVLLTHGNQSTAHAIRTLHRVYDFKAYGGMDSNENVSLVNIKSETHFEISGLVVESLFLPGHYLDSIVYRIGPYLFPGDLLSAGLIPDTDGAYGKALLIQCLQESILEMPDRTLVLPTFGPPSTVGIERVTNQELKLSPELST